MDRQSPPHEFLHGLSALTRNVYHAALVLHESNGTVGHKQRERDTIQIVRLQRAALQRFGPGQGNLPAQRLVFDPLDLRPELDHCVLHRIHPQHPDNSAYRGDVARVEYLRMVSPLYFRTPRNLRSNARVTLSSIDII